MSPTSYQTAPPRGEEVILYRWSPAHHGEPTKPMRPTASVPLEVVAVARTGQPLSGEAEAGVGRRRRPLRPPLALLSGPRRRTRGPASEHRARIRAAAVR